LRVPPRPAAAPAKSGSLPLCRHPRVRQATARRVSALPRRRQDAVASLGPRMARLTVLTAPAVRHGSATVDGLPGIRSWSRGGRRFASHAQCPRSSRVLRAFTIGLFPKCPSLRSTAQPPGRRSRRSDTPIARFIAVPKSERTPYDSLGTSNDFCSIRLRHRH
jgi:hypothetical protein